MSSISMAASAKGKLYGKALHSALMHDLALFCTIIEGSTLVARANVQNYEKQLETLGQIV